MDTLMIIVTLASLAMAVGMGAIVVKLVREEGRRSDARVAALVAMSDDSDVQAPAATPVEPVIRRGRVVAASAPRRSAPVYDADLELRPSAASASLFSPSVEPSPWGARAAVAAVMAVIACGLGFVLFTRTPETSAPAPARATQQAPVTAPPLELVSLRHARQNNALAVTGLVQNPHAGVSLANVVATAFAFDANGTLLARGQAPLDFTTLAPGDESPFVVSIPVSGTVARYRIGFRSSDGRVIAHVDRRPADDAVARR